MGHPCVWVVLIISIKDLPSVHQLKLQLRQTQRARCIGSQPFSKKDLNQPWSNRVFLVLPYVALKDHCYEAHRGKDFSLLSWIEYKKEITVATELLVELKIVDYKIVKIKIEVKST